MRLTDGSRRRVFRKILSTPACNSVPSNSRFSSSQIRPPGARKRDNVIEEKIPFRHAPKSRHLVAVETNHVRGDDIEFLAEIGEGNEFLDAPNRRDSPREARSSPIKHRHRRRDRGRQRRDRAIGRCRGNIRCRDPISSTRLRPPRSSSRSRTRRRLISIQVGRSRYFGRRIARILNVITLPYFFELLVIDRFDNRVRIEVARHALVQSKTAQAVTSHFRRRVPLSSFPSL